MLTHEVEEFSMAGVQDACYHVPQEFNVEADELARFGIVVLTWSIFSIEGRYPTLKCVKRVH